MRFHRSGIIAVMASLALAVGTLAAQESDSDPVPVDYIKSEYRQVEGTCVPQTSGVFYVRNEHNSRSITVFVEITWTYNNERRSEIRVSTLRPLREWSLGCRVPGPSRQSFNHKVIAATWPDG